MMMVKLGKTLAKARYDAGYTQLDLANQMGVKQSYISQMEKDQRPVSIMQIKRMPPALRMVMLEATETAIAEQLEEVRELKRRESLAAGNGE